MTWEGRDVSALRGDGRAHEVAGLDIGVHAAKRGRRKLWLLLPGLVAVVVGAAGLGAAVAAPGGGEARWVAVQLPGSNPQANAINERGWIVGDVETGGCYHAALWVKGRLRDLGTLGGECSIANDVNDRGQVVGWSLRAGESFGSMRAFLWENGKMRDLGITCGEATAINGRGQVVGGIDGDCARPRAWMWERGKVRWLLPAGRPASKATDVNDRGEVVGWAAGVFLYRNGKARILGIGSDFGGASINDRGQIVTSGSGLLWEKGRTTRLGFSAGAVNERGQVVGCALYQAVVVWTAGERTTLRVPAGATERCANDINDRGQIVGYSQEGPVEGGTYWAWRWQPVT